MNFTKTVYGYIMAVRYHLDNEMPQKGFEEVKNLSESTLKGIRNICNHVTKYLNEDQIQEEDF